MEFICLFQSPVHVWRSHPLSLIFFGLPLLPVGLSVRGVRRGVRLLGDEQPTGSRPGKPPLMCLYCPASVHYVAAFYSISGLLKLQWPKWQGSLGFQDVDMSPP